MTAPKDYDPNDLASGFGDAVHLNNSPVNPFTTAVNDTSPSVAFSSVGMLPNDVALMQCNECASVVAAEPGPIDLHRKWHRRLERSTATRVYAGGY